MNVQTTEDQMLGKDPRGGGDDRLVPRAEQASSPEARRTITAEIGMIVRDLQIIEQRVRALHAEMHRLRSLLA